MKATPILCLDLDGTVRKGYDEIGKFVNKKEDVYIFSGVLVCVHLKIPQRPKPLSF